MNAKTITAQFILALGLLGLFALVLSQQAENKTSTRLTRPDTPPPVVSVKPAAHYEFAGETVPFGKSFDLRERLDRELQIVAYRHSNTLDIIKLSGRYFPIFEDILREYDLPEDLRYIAVAESGLRHLSSPAGARGIWQFLKSSAEEYGLEISKDVDERLHVEKATRAACQKLKDLYKRFDSWILAAAAYNMGASALADAIEKQGSRSFFDLNLNDETSRYIFRILAYKDLFERPEAFGYRIKKDELYKPLNNYKEVKVNKDVPSWAEFVRQHSRGHKQKLSYRMLKVYNPWLISSGLKVKSGKTYRIRLPR